MAVDCDSLLSVHEQRQTMLMNEMEERFVILRYRRSLPSQQRASLVASTRVCVYRLEKHVEDALALLTYGDDAHRFDSPRIARQLDMRAYATAAHLRLDLVLAYNETNRHM